MTPLTPMNLPDPTSPLAPESRTDSALMEQWLEAINLRDDLSAETLLRRIYRHSVPQQAEIIFTSACEFRCAHCIYSPAYTKQNSSIEVGSWLHLLDHVSSELGITTFVYSGRAVTATGTELLASLRSQNPTCRIGLIDNAISFRPHLSALTQAHLDWVDVSFDGDPESHDRQRGRKGAFAEALAGLELLQEVRLAPRLNILTCVTRINQDSIPDMIRFFNRRGIKNFFLTPMAVEPDARPSPALRLTPEEVAQLAGRLDGLCQELDDAYVELGLFEPDHWVAVKALKGLSGHDHSEEDHFEWLEEIGTTTRTFRYSPGSLTGIRELILNTDGRVIVPKSMAWDSFRSELVAGDFYSRSAQELWQSLPEGPAFSHYLNELRRERQVFSQTGRFYDALC